MTFSTVAEIYAALDKTRGKLTDAVSNLTDAQADFRPSEDKWSTALIVEHLAKTEANLVRVVAKLLRAAEAENAPFDGTINPPVSFAEMAEKVRGSRLEAPEFIRPVEGVPIAESLKKLAESRAAIQELRPRIESVAGYNAQYPHPFFGNLNLYEWVAFIGLHEMHHLRQINDRLAEMQPKNN
jgi:hypothetical protein